jgi:hypothetical protein
LEEIDKVFPSWQQLEAAISALGMPLPNLAVAHRDDAGRVHHPHLLWLLHSSVAFNANGKIAPQALFKHVLTKLTAALLPIGSDPGGLSKPIGTRTLAARCGTTVCSHVCHLISQGLRDGIAAVSKTAMNTVKVALGEGRLRDQIFAPLDPDHSDPAVAAQSNRVFANLRVAAWQKVSWYRD